MQSKAAMIVPLLIFFVLGALIDTSPVEDGHSINGPAYFASVAARAALMLAAIGFFAKPILRQFPLQIDIWGFAVGIVGAVLWIGICELGLERGLLATMGVTDDWLPSREGVDPFVTYAAGIELAGFLAARFCLLAVSVPIAEELFLRGFVMRAFEVEDWPSLPLTQIGRTGLIIGTVYGILTHPGEIFAAAVWFTLVTVLMVKSGKFWNCVLAHAVTNLILGIYVCLFSKWWLW